MQAAMPFLVTWQCPIWPTNSPHFRERESLLPCGGNGLQPTNIHIACFFKTHFNIIAASSTSSTKQPLSIRFSDKKSRHISPLTDLLQASLLSINFGLSIMKVLGVSFIASLSAAATSYVPADAEYFCSCKLRWYPGRDKREGRTQTAKNSYVYIFPGFMPANLKFFLRLWWRHWW